MGIEENAGLVRWSSITGNRSRKIYATSIERAVHHVPSVIYAEASGINRPWITDMNIERHGMHIGQGNLITFYQCNVYFILSRMTSIRKLSSVDGFPGHSSDDWDAWTATHIPWDTCCRIPVRDARLPAPLSCPSLPLRDRSRPSRGAADFCRLSYRVLGLDGEAFG